MPIRSKECYFGYDDLVKALEPYAYVDAMEVGGCRHERGHLRVDLMVMPSGGFFLTAPANPDSPTRQECADMRGELYVQAERAIKVLEDNGFDHWPEPKIEIAADSRRRLECTVRCEGVMPLCAI